MNNLITSEGLHVWNPDNPFHPNTLLCSMPGGELRYFTNKDQAVNGLFIDGFKQSAREINKHQWSK